MKILEASETPSGESIYTIRGSRGGEYVLNADRLAQGFADLLDKRDYERKMRWNLEANWFDQEIKELVAMAVPAAQS